MSQPWPSLPATFVSGATLPASSANLWSSALNWFYNRTAQCKVRASSGTSISNNSTPAAFTSWDSTDYQRGTMWSSGSPSRVTIPTSHGGTYLITASINVPTAGANSCALYLAKNVTSLGAVGGSSTAVIASDAKTGAAVGDTWLNISTIHKCAAGDFFILFVYQSTGASKTVGNGGAEHAAHFTFEYLSQ